MPRPSRLGRQPAAQYDGHDVPPLPVGRRLDRLRARRVPVARASQRHGDGEDFVAPPFMLSAERTPSEVTWSLGEYTTGGQIWNAFELEGDPPAPVGVFAHQPSPYAGLASRYCECCTGRSCCCCSSLCGVRSSRRAQPIFQGSYVFQPGAQRGRIRHAGLRGRQPRQQRRDRDADEPAKQLDRT